MKKTLLLLFLSAFSLSFAQTDLFTALQKFGTDTEYKVYRMYKSGDGYELDSWENKIKFEIIKNKFGKPAGLKGFYAKTGKVVVHDNLEYKVVDHYSKPAFLRERINFKETHIVVDSIVYMLWNLEEDGSSFTIKRIYLPQLNSAKKEEGKKLSVKEKMAAAKNSLKSAKAEMDYLGAIQKMDHVQKIKDYIAAMKASQPPYTAQEKKEMAEIAEDLQRRNEEGEQKNAEFWASEQGQRILNEGKDSDAAWVSIQNETGQRLQVITQLGTSSHISSGSSSNFKCNTNVYYCHKDEFGNFTQRGSLLYEAGSQCGGSITVR